MSWGERKGFLQEYVVRMFHAGYSESFRLDIVKQSIARYEGMLNAYSDGHPFIVSETGRNRREGTRKVKRRKVGLRGVDMTR